MMEEAARSDKRKKKTGPEAMTVAGKGSPEHIGHTLVAAESTPKVERNPLKIPLESLVEKSAGNKMHAATMSRTELLAVSETIFIDGSSLRQIYETHLIGERGLRRIVAEQLKGGDLRDALRMEVMEREMDFERDPKLRDKTRIETVEASDASIDDLIGKAEVGSKGKAGQEQVAFYKAQAKYEATRNNHKSQQRQLIDVAVVAVISFLLLLIIILVMAR